MNESNVVHELWFQGPNKSLLYCLKVGPDGVLTLTGGNLVIDGGEVVSNRPPPPPIEDETTHDAEGEARHGDKDKRRGFLGGRR